MASCRCHKAVYTRGSAFEQPLESQVDVPTGRNQPLEAEKPLIADYVVPVTCLVPCSNWYNNRSLFLQRCIVMYKVLVSFADS